MLLGRVGVGAGLAEGGQQVGLARLGGGEMRRLDVAVTADVLGDRRDLDGERVVVVVEAGDQRLDDRLILDDQAALGAPIGRVAERVEGAAAQPP